MVEVGALEATELELSMAGRQIGALDSRATARCEVGAQGWLRGGMGGGERDARASRWEMGMIGLGHSQNVFLTIGQKCGQNTIKEALP